MSKKEEAHEILDKIIQSNDFQEITELREELHGLLDELAQEKVEAHVQKNSPDLYKKYVDYKEKKK